LVGDVILTPCDIEDDEVDDSDAAADGEDVVGGIDGDCCFVVSFVPDMFDEDDNGIFGDGENVV
jgi:hypothetical protein